MEDLLQVVKAYAAPHYEVYGELGRENDSDIWYLGRDLSTAQLVALRLREAGQGPDGELECDLTVANELDASVAVGLGGCHNCGARLRRWIQFCTDCGADLTQGGRIPSTPEQREALLFQVKVAATDVYEVLGEMPWAGGAGIVYFATERASGRLVRLRLSAEADGLGIRETGFKPHKAEATYLTQFHAPVRRPHQNTTREEAPVTTPHVEDPAQTTRRPFDRLSARLRAEPALIIKAQAGVIVFLLLVVIYLMTTR